MDRGIEMSAGMLDDVPPEQIEPVLPEVELALHFDAGPAHEGRKVRRHGVGEVHHVAEAPHFRSARRHGCRRKSGCGRAREEASPAQGGPDLGFTGGDANIFSSSLVPYLATILVVPSSIGNRRADAGGVAARI